MNGEAEAEAPAEPQQQSSAFAARLLGLWSAGTLSGILVQSLAHLAVLDGASHEEIGLLASCGAWGSQPGNIARDIHKHFLSDLRVAEPTLVNMTCLDSKTSSEVTAEAAVFLPHQMFAALREYSSLSGLFDPSKLQAFWAQVVAKQDPKLHNHPMVLQDDWQKTFIPVFVHGDGVEFQTRDSLLVYSWGFLLAQGASSDTSYLMACFPKSATTKQDKGRGTWDPILNQLRDSFCAAFRGTWPSGPQEGEALVAGGFKLVLWSLLGDHDYFSNTLGLNHWAAHSMCWCCDASSQDHGKHWKKHQPEARGWRTKTPQQCLDSQPTHQFFEIPGASTLMVAHDLLHVLWCKGVLSHLLGSSLHVWLWPDKNRRQRPTTPAQDLAKLFLRIQELYKQFDAGTRLTNLRIAMFVDEKAHWQGHPFLSIKGAECKHLLPCMTKVAGELAGGEEFGERLEACMQAINAFSTLIDTSDTFLSDEQGELAEELVLSFLDHYEWLTKWAESKDRQDFHQVPKFHMLLHVAETAKFMNPKMQWCFKSEDFVGKIATLGHSVSMGVASKNISQKICQKYRHWLHFRLTRGDSFEE